MKEKPILFSGEMVRAILAGRKTQTRRIVKPQPQTCLQYELAFVKRGYWRYPSKGLAKMWSARYAIGNIPEDELNRRWTPPCCFGDMLYVRETFRPAWTREMEDGAEYAADHAVLPVDVENGASGCHHHRCNQAFRWEARCECAYDENGNNIAKWIPSIHMPKWAARIWLKVREVRVERLREITEADATAEGTTVPENGTARDAFRRVWEACYGTESWMANPYVWVIEFERKERKNAE